MSIINSRTGIYYHFYVNGKFFNGVVHGNRAKQMLLVMINYKNNHRRHLMSVCDLLLMTKFAARMSSYSLSGHLTRGHFGASLWLPSSYGFDGISCWPLEPLITAWVHGVRMCTRVAWEHFRSTCSQPPSHVIWWSSVILYIAMIEIYKWINQSNIK